MEIDFERLTKLGITPINILHSLLPDNKIVEKYREGIVNDEIIKKLLISDPHDAYMQYFSTYAGLEGVLDYRLEKLYFEYSSGLPRAEFPFIRNVPEISEEYRIVKSTSSGICDSVSNTETLFGVTLYQDEENPIYYLEPESDYLLLARNWKCYSYTEEIFKHLDKFINSARKQNIDLLLFFSKNRIRICDTREKYKFLYHRTYNYSDINSQILDLLQGDIFKVLAKVIQRINPIILRQKLSPTEYRTLQNIEQTTQTPDQSPQIVEVLRKLGVSDSIISNYVVYPSGRPRTTLSFIPNIKKLKNIENYEIITGDANPSRCWLLSPELFGKHKIIEEDILIPVVRYQAGMSRGLYNEEYSDKFCGTFYYFEPNSEYFLVSEKILIAVNKMTAYYYLQDSNDKEKSKIQILDLIHSSLFYLTDQEVESSFNRMLVGVVKYNKNMYAIEDIYDQVLCKLASSKGIDTIILAGMTGQSRIVTEVLDTRSREESFSSIYQKTNIILQESDEIN